MYELQEHELFLEMASKWIRLIIAVSVKGNASSEAIVRPLKHWEVEESLIKPGWIKEAEPDCQLLPERRLLCAGVTSLL